MVDVKFIGSGTEEFKYNTKNSIAFKAEIDAQSAPYDIDIETRQEGGSWTKAIEESQTIQTTDENVISTGSIKDEVRVLITNNSGESTFATVNPAFKNDTDGLFEFLAESPDRLDRKVPLSFYNGKKVGVSESETADLINTKELDNVFYASQFDGANGGEQIQNALDEADAEPGQNGVIVGPVGPDSPSSAPESDVWAVSSRIDPTGYDHTQLIGLGKPMLFLADGTSEDVIRAGLDTNSPVTDDLTIRGFRIHGNKSNNSTEKRDPDGDGNTEIKGSCCLRMIRCENLTIEDCELTTSNRFGISIKLPQGRVKVEDCVSDNHGDDGFTVSNQYYQVQDPDTALTVFEDVEAFDNSDQGIEIEDGARHVIVRDSLFHNNPAGLNTKTHPQQDGVTEEEAVDDVRVIDCNFEDNGVGAAFTGPPSGLEAKNFELRGCHFKGQDSVDTLLRGARQKDITIADCHYDVSSEQGIRSQISGSSPIKGVTIENVHVEVTEQINTSGRGMIFLRDVEDLFVDARVYCNGLSNGWGIEIGPNAEDWTVSDETVVEEADGPGLMLDSNGGTIEDGKYGGVYRNNGQDSFNKNLSGVKHWIRNGGTITDVIADGVRAYDDQETATQENGIARGGDYNIYVNCNLRGVSTAFANTLASNSLTANNIT